MAFKQKPQTSIDGFELISRNCAKCGNPFKAIATSSAKYCSKYCVGERKSGPENLVFGEYPNNKPFLPSGAVNKRNK